MEFDSGMKPSFGTIDTYPDFMQELPELEHLQEPASNAQQSPESIYETKGKGEERPPPELEILLLWRCWVRR